MRTDFASEDLRRLAKRAKNTGQALRLLAIAAILDGASRKDAAKAGGMDHQTLRDWVIRFNAKGPEGLINIPSPGAPPKLNDTHKAFLARIIGLNPNPEIHDATHRRARDLVLRLQEEFGILVSDDTIYRALKALGLPRGRSSRKHAEAIPKPRSRSKKLCLCTREIGAELVPQEDNCSRSVIVRIDVNDAEESRAQCVTVLNESE